MAAVAVCLIHIRDARWRPIRSIRASCIRRAACRPARRHLPHCGHKWPQYSTLPSLGVYYSRTNPKTIQLLTATILPFNSAATATTTTTTPTTTTSTTLPILLLPLQLPPPLLLLPLLLLRLILHVCPSRMSSRLTFRDCSITNVFTTHLPRMFLH